MKDKKGITLMTLTITIIILLILAGVVLNIALGGKGIFKHAKRGVEEYNEKTATEKINLKITNVQIDTYSEQQRMPTLQELADNFCEDEEIQYVELESKKIGNINKIEIGQNTSFFTKLKQYPYEFEINESLQLASIDIVKISSTEKEEVIPEGYIQPSGTKIINQNGNYNIAQYANAEVNVPIPEGYIRPSGTQKITTKNSQIDVRNYEYIDTTNLYTADEAQSGEGIYWKEDTFTFSKTSSSMEYTCGFKPRIMLLEAKLTNGDVWNFYSYNYCNNVISNAVGRIEDCSDAFVVTEQGIKLVNWAKDARGCKIKIYVIK
ncbi:MAG: hypothetical protein HFJ42_08320 [Clostridia bacterium]|nr:hypothetical protein [Clostridia bacterium]